MDSVLSSLVSDKIGPESLQRELVKDLSTVIEAAGGFALREYERAIRLALDSIGLEREDEVLLSALSPVSYHRAIEAAGLVPVPVDIYTHSMCIDVDEVARRVEGGAKAVIADSPLGFIPELEKLADLDVPLIEDITMSIGGHTGEAKSGSYGEYVIIRLEAEDLITAGGGAVVLAGKRGGYTRLKQQAELLPPEAYLPDMNAALAKVQIKELDYYFERRRELYSLMFKSLQKGRHSAPVQGGEAEAVAYSFPVLVEGAVKEVQSYARKKGIETRRAYTQATLAFLDGNSEEGGSSFPKARNYLNRCILFPLYPRLPKNEVDTIGKVLSTLP